MPPTFDNPNIARPALACFDTQWQADSYLSDYYSRLETDERVTIRFLTEVADRMGDVPVLLEFGCGPTVHHLFAFAEHAGEIHVADYLGANLDAVRHWVDTGGDAHDWSPFADYTLRCEQGRAPTANEVSHREALTRRRLTTFLRADARCRRPLIGSDRERPYPAVLCCFCPDSITDDLNEWRRCMTNVTSLVAPDGWLVVAALRGAASYRVGGVHFPSAGVTEDEVAELLDRTGFGEQDTTLTVAEVADECGFGFSSVILAAGRRSCSRSQS